MTKLLYVDYLAACLHMVKARPGKRSVFCSICKGQYEAVEIRKV